MRINRYPFLFFVMFHVGSIIFLVQYIHKATRLPQRPMRYRKHEREAHARQQHELNISTLSQDIQDGLQKFIMSKDSKKNGTRSDETIPKIIHQIWNDVYIPTEFTKNIQSFTKHNTHPAWQYYLWTMESAYKFITDKYPEYLGMYMASEDNITRSDVIRYLVLYEYGGVYFDLDTVSVKSLDEFVASHSCAFVNEPLEHISLVYNMPLLLTNAAMLCRQNHPFIRNILDTLESYRHVTKCVGAFQCTGPLALTRLYLYHTRVRMESFDIDIAPTEYFQSIYDERVLKQEVTLLCKNIPKLIGDQKKACEQLKMRAHTQNAHSARAYTYHTWYHVTTRGVTISHQNHIKKIVPHAKIYGTV